MTSLQSTQVLFVDSTVHSHEQLLTGLEANVQVFVLEAEKDGVEQITEVISQLRAEETIGQSLELHLISHGVPGCLYLGNSELSLDTLKAYEAQITAWSVSELLIYGCTRISHQ